MTLYTRPRFYRDVAHERLYLLEHAGADIAEKWYQELRPTIALLQTHPLIGRERKDVRHPSIRSWRVNRFRRWLIFYQVVEDGLVLHRVVYGKRDLPRLAFE